MYSSCFVPTDKFNPTWLSVDIPMLLLAIASKFLLFFIHFDYSKLTSIHVHGLNAFAVFSVMEVSFLEVNLFVSENALMRSYSVFFIILLLHRIYFLFHVYRYILPYRAQLSVARNLQWLVILAVMTIQMK